MPNVSTDVDSLLTSADKAAMRDVLDVVPGTDVQAYDPKLSTSATLNPLIQVTLKNITVLTTGAPADLATVSLPAWLTGYVMLSVSRCVAETAAGTLGGATFSVYQAAGAGGGFGLVSTFAGPTAAGNAVAVNGGATTPGRATSSTLYLRQLTNSANAGTVSVYLNLVPLL